MILRVISPAGPLIYISPLVSDMGTEGEQGSLNGMSVHLQHPKTRHRIIAVSVTSIHNNYRGRKVSGNASAFTRSRKFDQQGLENLESRKFKLENIQDRK